MMNSTISDGFLVGQHSDSVSDVALLSLRVALESYFATYKEASYAFPTISDRSGSIDQATLDFNHPLSYSTACVETVLHFQHFTELVVKEVLRSEHPLLADVASNGPVIFHKLLKNEPLTDEETRGLRSLEFSESYNRLRKLILEGRIDPQHYQFLADAKGWLEDLNVLRNRMWHRGAFVLRYPALDEFVVRNILPFILRVTQFPRYAGKEFVWKHGPLACAVDPISDLVSLSGQQNLNLKHVAFLKELGRAAYANPYTHHKLAKYFNEVLRKRAERAAAQEHSDANVADVQSCPVCGTESLIVYDDFEADEFDPEGGTYSKAWRYTREVECRQCSFSINNHVDNASSFGLPIPDYWTSEEL